MGGFVEPIPQEQAAALHQRLLDGDVTASAEIAESFFVPLQKYSVDHWSWHYPTDLIEAAVTDAFANYLERPSQYDAQSTTLGRYFVMSTHWDLLNLIRDDSRLGIRGLPREKKAKDRPDTDVVPKQGQFVELDTPGREYEIEDQADLSVEERAAIRSAPLWSKLDKLLPDVQDREMLFLMIEGFRDTSEYAAVLNITALPKETQEAEVKKHKDRIKKMIQRHLPRTELEK